MTLVVFVGRMLLVPVRVALFPVAAIVSFVFCMNCEPGEERWISPLDEIWGFIEQAVAHEWHETKMTARAFERVEPSDDHLLRPM